MIGFDKAPAGIVVYSATYGKGRINRVLQNDIQVLHERPKAGMQTYRRKDGAHSSEAVESRLMYFSAEDERKYGMSL